MHLLNRAKRSVTNLFRKQRMEETLDAELRGYLDERIRFHSKQGMDPDHARYQATLDMGGLEQIKEEVRDAWLGRTLESAFQDLRYGCRSLARSPGFTLIAVATLTLGIGANLTIFSLLRAVLWRPLPYPDPARIVTIRVDARNVANTGATRRELLSLQQRSRSLENVSTIDAFSADLSIGGASEYVPAAHVTDEFLPSLGARPALGRLLDARVDLSGEQPLAVVISDQLWRRRFAADPAVLGKSLQVNDVPVKIVGVLPPGLLLFLPPSVTDAEHVDLWLPDRVDPAVPYRGLPILARLKPGVTLDQANAELQTLAAQFERENPGFYAGPNGWQASPADRGLGIKVHFAAQSIHDDLTREARPLLLLLSATVVFVFLIACVNVANLLLARGSSRQRELDIRRALGAPLFRVIRQLLAESLVLALVSSAAGLLLGQLALRAIEHQTAWHLPMQTTIGMDRTVLVFAVLLALLTCLLSGLAPAWRVCSEATGQLRAGRSETVGLAARQWQRALVVAEVALSIVPLVCGGLMLRSFVNLLHTPLGFDPANVVTVTVPLDSKRYPTLERRWNLLQAVLDRARALPGVESASAADPLPLNGQEMRRVGRADQPDTPPILASQQFALPGYLRTMRTPLRAGRDFTDTDIVADRATTIIDQQLATRLWPEGAFGKRLTIFRSGRRDEVEVVGVAESARLTRVRDENTPHFLLPYGLYPANMSLVVRTRSDAERLAPEIQATVDAVRTGQPPVESHLMSEFVAESVGDTRFMMFVLTAFAAASVLLAAIGLYGTLTYLTVQRTREFGIRLAIGSSVSAIIAIVVRESAMLALVGAALGLAGASAVARAIRGMLYGVHPLDSWTLLGVIALVGIVALISASIPAWRAARTDPQICLRSE